MCCTSSICTFAVLLVLIVVHQGVVIEVHATEANSLEVGVDGSSWRHVWKVFVVEGVSWQQIKRRYGHDEAEKHGGVCWQPNIPKRHQYHQLLGVNHRPKMLETG